MTVENCFNKFQSANMLSVIEQKQLVLYYEVASSKSAVINKPRNASQTNTQNKLDIFSNINPAQNKD